jgi:hypothetical protein
MMEATSLRELCIVQEVVGNAVSSNEARLLKGDKLLDELLEPLRKHAGDDLHDAVLEKDWAKTIRSDHLCGLGWGGAAVEFRNKAQKVILHHGPRP